MKNLITALVLATSFAAFADDAKPAADAKAAPAKKTTSTTTHKSSSSSTSKKTTTKPAADKPADAAPAK
ncbi:MAG: hypothetical protein ACLPJH_20245 [Myxococcaceae bacterium]